MADTVIKYDLSLGVVLAGFELTLSTAHNNMSPSHRPAAELSITVPQMFSFWEEPLKPVWYHMYFRAHPCTMWEDKEMEQILS